MRISVAFVLLALPLIAEPASAQSSADEAAVVATVNRFFDGMRQRDTTLISGTVTSDATLLTSGGASGVANRSNTAAFMRAVGAATGAAWNEQIFEPVVRIDGPLATVWTRYTFSLGTTFSHCGVDAVHLVRVDERWRIRHMADSRRTVGCPDDVSQEEAPAVLAATERWLDALNSRDTAAMRAVNDSGMRTLVAGGPTGIRSARTLSDLLGQLATTSDRFDERMVRPEVRIDGPLAEVWAPYTFGLNGSFSHCGADAFQLVKRASGWVVAQLTYSTRRDGCEPLRR